MPAQAVPPPRPPAAAPARTALPGWWKAMASLPGLDCRFVQTSESAVFGRMERKGRLQTAKGGRLRVAYDSGLLLVSDGEALVHFDPEARTAQRLELRAAMLDLPLLNLLVDPSALPESYILEAGAGETVRLRPRRPGLPDVRVEGQGHAATRLRWKDGTGAEQELRLLEPRVVPSPPSAAFRFEAPRGTRWLR
jgi:outer membrane lipoprotein-sorting protein